MNTNAEVQGILKFGIMEWAPLGVPWILARVIGVLHDYPKGPTIFN